MVRISEKYPYFYEAREDDAHGLNEEIIYNYFTECAIPYRPTVEQEKEGMEDEKEAFIICIKDEKLLLLSFMGRRDTVGGVLVTDDISQEGIRKDFGLEVGELKCIRWCEPLMYLCTEFEIVNPEPVFQFAYHMVSLKELDKCEYYPDTYNLICGDGTNGYAWLCVLNNLFGGMPTADGVIKF